MRKGECHVVEHVLEDVMSCDVMSCPWCHSRDVHAYSSCLCWY